MAKVVRISDEHHAALERLAQAKGIDLAGAFAHALDVAHRAHAGAAGPAEPGASREAEHRRKAAAFANDAMSKASEQRGDPDEALERLGPGRDDDSASEEDASESSSSDETKDAPKRSPLHRWAVGSTKKSRR